MADAPPYDYDVMLANRGLKNPPNGLGHIRWLIEQGRAVNIFNWADSLSNSASAPREYGFRVGDVIAATYPNATVYVDTWNVNNSTFDTRTVIQTGSGPVVTIRNFAVPGAPFQYAMGTLWATSSSLATVTPDILLTCHGHNHVAGTALEIVRGEFLAALEMYRLYHPGVPIVPLIENPQYDNNNMATAYAAWNSIAPLRDIALVDGYSAFIAAGKPVSWYQDPLEGPPVVHPSDIGFASIQAAFKDLWDRSPARPAIATPSLITPTLPNGQNLISNGDFSKWTTAPGVPDGWTVSAAGGALVPDKETTIVRDPRLGYSVKLLGTGVSTAIYQDLPSGVYANMRGLPVTFTAWLYRPAGATGTVGRIGISSATPGGPVAQSSRGYNVNQVGWMPWVISGFTVPVDATSLRVTLYHDTNSTPSTSPAYFDSCTLTPGLLPRSVR